MSIVTAKEPSLVGAQVGIDVAQDWLDVSVDGGKAFRVSNDDAGIVSLMGRLSEGATVHLEASGGYERVARRRLVEAGFVVRTLDPLKVRRSAQSKGKNGKTDSLDARHLSEEGSSLQAHPPKSGFREELCDLSRTLDQLKSAASEMKLRANVPGLDPMAVETLIAASGLLRKEAAKLEREFVKRVKSSPLKERYLLAQSIPGVGPCLARVLVCELPEDLEAFTDAQLTSYGGVAPLDNSSGKRKGKAHIGRGNARIKGALYMPALNCVQRQEWARSLYARLKAKKHEHQQAVVAVMRRLLLRAVQVLRRGTPWQTDRAQA